MRTFQISTLPFSPTTYHTSSMRVGVLAKTQLENSDTAYSSQSVAIHTTSQMAFHRRSLKDTAILNSIPSLQDGTLVPDRCPWSGLLPDRPHLDNGPCNHYVRSSLVSHTPSGRRSSVPSHQPKVDFEQRLAYSCYSILYD